MVGASRERVNKAIASFVRLGWIDQADRRYRILDREQLTRRRPLTGSVVRKAIARRQASAASSGRWAGRAASCTKPCSAPGVAHHRRRRRPRSAATSSGGVHGSTVADDRQTSAQAPGAASGVERLDRGRRPASAAGTRIIP